MRHTIMYDRIEPLTPIKEPTLVRSGLLSINPSATNAKPEYALSTVITTAAVVSKLQYRGTVVRTHICATNCGSCGVAF